MREPLKLGIVCFPALGGSGVIASELAFGLACRGHQVHLISTAPPLRELPPCPNERFHAVSVPPYPLFESAPYTLALASTLVEVARGHRLDLLQVHYAVPHAASAMLARQVLGPDAPALVVSLHGTDVTKIGPDPAYRSVTSYAIAAADGITVPSAWLQREARRLLDLDGPRPIEILPNFVDTDHFTPALQRDPSTLAALFRSADQTEGPYLIHVSNFREVKRTTDLVEVLSRIRQRLPAKLLLIGDGPTRVATERRASELALQHAVRFLGRRAEFVALLQQADGFLLTSETESFGVAALEALATGVPVFGYRVGGVPDVVVDGTGVLAPPFDAGALATAVIDTVSDPARHAALRRAARDHAVAHFAEQPALDRYEQYFRRVIGARRSETMR